jgi:hypothetical protein
LTGCGGGKSPVTVSGKLVLPNTLKLADTDNVTISFLPEDKADLPAMAMYSKESGTFECKTTVGKAKYNITVRIDPYMGAPDAEKRAASFETVNNAFSRDATKLKYETTQDGKQSITVDLTAGTVTKN